MRNISFFLTQEQFRARTKYVTRRLGWRNVKVGELLQGIVKGQGLKKGQHPVKLVVIRVKSKRRERLNRMLKDEAYGWRECEREGFPDLAPQGFVDMFTTHNKCKPSKRITRIEFEYL